MNIDIATVLISFGSLGDKPDASDRRVSDFRNNIFLHFDPSLS